MRSIVYRYDDLEQLSSAIDGSQGYALPVPAREVVRDGEWVLAMFELAGSRRATAAAARGAVSADGPVLVFEGRDWERLRQFAIGVRSDGSSYSSGLIPIAKALPGTVENILGAATPGGTDPFPQGARGAPSPPPARPSAPMRAAVVARQPEREQADTPERPDAASGAGAGRATVPSSPLSGKGARVLVVDDDPDLRRVVETMLEAVGLQVTTVGSAEEAMIFARSTPPDLLMLDWGLPGMSGLEFCRRVRRETGMATVPILFLTAHSETQEMVEAFAAGADDYVVKPFRAAELGARIFGLLRRARVASKRVR